MHTLPLDVVYKTGKPDYIIVQITNNLLQKTISVDRHFPEQAGGVT